MNAPIDVTHIRIETPRLILRPWERADLDDLYAYASVPGVGEMAGWSHHGSIEESRQILDMFIREKKVFALVLKQEQRVIGSLGIEELDAEAAMFEKLGRELGYVLSKAYWGQGIMAEAVEAVISYCFQTLGYDFLACGHFAWNAQSRRVIEKCGFAYWKNTKHETRYGTVEDTLLYILYNDRKR